MKLKKVKGTLRHDFDTDLVLKYLKENTINLDEYPRILENACHVISSLRYKAQNIKISAQAILDLCRTK